MNNPKDQKTTEKSVQTAIIINVPDHIKIGVYSNLVNITITSNQEVMFDFAYVHPSDKDTAGKPTGQVVSRVILPLTIARAMKLVMDSQMGKPKET